MSSTYNAITNLQEIEMDSLIVNTATINTALVDNLDCNVGVIDTLSSTTATLTSANIPTLTNTTLTNTTSNTTNLNTNNIQPNPVSSAVSLYTTGTGVLTLGNTSNSNLITINQTTLLQADKNLNLSGTGRIITPNIRVSGLTLNKLVLSNGSNDLVSSSWAESDLVILSANNTFTGNNTFSTFNTFNGNILANTLRGTTASSAISLYSTTTGGITIGGSSSGINLSDNTILPANKTITLNATGGKVLCNTYEGTSATNSINLFTTTTGVGNPTITLGNLTGGTFSINPNTTMNGNLTLASSKTITLNTTGGKVLCNVFTGTTTSSAMSLGESGDTSNITFYKNINMGATRFITIQSDGTLYVNTITATDATLSAVLFSNHTGNINIGYTISSNPINLNCSTTLASNKNLTLQGSGKITTPSILVSGLTANKLVLTDGSDNLISSSYTDTDFARLTADNTFSGTTNTFSNTIVCNTISGALLGSISLYGGGIGTTISLGSLLGGGLTIYENTTLGINKNLTLQGTGKITTPNILVSGLTASKLVLTDGSKNLISSSYTDTDFVLKGGSSMTGTLNVNDIQGTTTSSAITLFTNSSVSSPTITLGNVSGGTLTINPNSSFSGSLGCNTISALSTTSTGSLYGNILGGVINIGSSLTGTMNIGNTGGGNLTINPSVVLATGKNLTLSTTGKIVVDTIEGSAPADNIVLFSTTTGTTTLGNTGGGNLTINPNIVLPANKKITLNPTGGIIECAKYNCTSDIQLNIGETNVNSSIIIGANMTGSVQTYFGGNVAVANGKNLIANYIGINGVPEPSLWFDATTHIIRIGAGQTSGGMTIGNTTPATDTGTLTINKLVVLPANKTITLNGTGGKVVCNTYEGTSASAQMIIGGNITTTPITIGAGHTTGNIFLSNTSNTGKVICRALTQFQTATESCYINTNSGANIFTATYLAGKYISSTTYAGAITDQWTCWDSNCENSLQDGCAIVQNGNTTMIINPMDQSSLWVMDEDAMTTASNYAWVGYKFSTTGVITTSSDRRIKRDINPIPVGSDLLDKLSLLEYVNYRKKAPKEEKYYKNGVLRRKYQQVHKGLIAQDVKQIFPDVVERESEDGYWTLKYPEVDIYFNMGVQELIKQNKSQQVEINNNKTLIDTQQTIIDDLTARLVRLEQLILNP